MHRMANNQLMNNNKVYSCKFPKKGDCIYISKKQARFLASLAVKDGACGFNAECIEDVFKMGIVDFLKGHIVTFHKSKNNQYRLVTSECSY